MNPAELRTLFEQKHPALDAWGECVLETIVRESKSRLQGKDKGFFKVEPKHRVKEVDSFLEKACGSRKSYRDPMNEITDLVGVRFVVLLASEIGLVSEVITSVSEWEKEKARDILRERDQNPHHFDYSSDHWIVRPKKDFAWKGITIAKGLPCEIQVRTLLQHAYAELAHSTVYKPRLSASPAIKRAIAKGAALIEATDSVFEEVTDKIRQGTKPLESIEEGMQGYYLTKVGDIGVELKVAEKLSWLILDAYSNELLEAGWPAIQAELDTIGWLGPVVMRERDNNPFFGYPVVMIVFWLIKKLRHEIGARWPLDKGLLIPFFTKLGIAADGCLD